MHALLFTRLPKTGRTSTIVELDLKQSCSFACKIKEATIIWGMGTLKGIDVKCTCSIAFFIWP